MQKSDSRSSRGEKSTIAVYQIRGFENLDGKKNMSSRSQATSRSETNRLGNLVQSKEMAGDRSESGRAQKDGTKNDHLVYRITPKRRSSRRPVPSHVQVVAEFLGIYDDSSQCCSTKSEQMSSYVEVLTKRERPSPIDHDSFIDIPCGIASGERLAGSAWSNDTSWFISRSA